jgi:hypothetical protein
MSNNKNTEDKDKQKKKDKVARSVTSKKELKDVEINHKILKQEAKVRTQGAKESTKTTIQLRNGTIKETYGERYGRPAEG